MRIRTYLAISTVAALTAASCGSDGSTNTSESADLSVKPADTATPETTPTIPPPPSIAEPTEESCSSVPSEGRSVEDIRAELAKIREADSGAIAQARDSFGYFPEVPAPTSAKFTDYAINMKESQGKTVRSTQIVFQGPGTIDDFFTFYRAEAEKLGWTETEALGSNTKDLQTISFTIPDFPDSKQAFSVKVFQDKGGVAGSSEVELSISVSGDASELGNTSDWYTWPQENVPLLEGGCYESGGATTNSPLEKNFDSLGKPGDNLKTAIKYDGLSELDAKDQLRKLGEEKGFTASEKGSKFVLTKDDLEVEYSIIAIDTQTSKSATIEANVNFPNP